MWCAWPELIGPRATFTTNVRITRRTGTYPNMIPDAPASAQGYVASSESNQNQRKRKHCYGLVALAARSENPRIMKNAGGACFLLPVALDAAPCEAPHCPH